VLDHLVGEVEFPAESEAGAVFLTDAVKAGTVEVSATPVDLVKVPNSRVNWPWLGEGRLTLTNKSDQTVTVRVRDGFEMAEPHQHMIGYVTGLANNLLSWSLELRGLAAHGATPQCGWDAPIATPDRTGKRPVFLATT
jgi:hypothetical protein